MPEQKREEKIIDKRKPKLEKVGCFHSGKGERGFMFFEEFKGLKNGDVFIYNRGILWKLK